MPNIQLVKFLHDIVTSRLARVHGQQLRAFVKADRHRTLLATPTLAIAVSTDEPRHRQIMTNSALNRRLGQQESIPADSTVGNVPFNFGILTLHNQTVETVRFLLFFLEDNFR